MSLSVPDSGHRNRSASTGESGLPQHEHKRPRLSDSQPSATSGGVLSTTPVDPVTIPPDSPKHASFLSNHAKPTLETPPRSPSSDDIALVASSTSSKVTINTRPLSSQSLNDNSTTETTTNMANDSISHPLTPSPTIQAAQAEPEQLVTRQDDNTHETISISSSDSASPPPIQVAAPQDYNQAPEATKWKPVHPTTAPKTIVMGRNFVQRTFPFAQPLEIGGAHKVIAHLSPAFSRGTAADAAVFTEVKVWLSDLVDNVSKLDRASIDAEIQFWTMFPQLVTSLLNREAQPPPGIELSDFVDFFAAFLRLTRLIADVEASRFHSYPENVDGKVIRTILTHQYLHLCQWILSLEAIPLYESLMTILDVSTSEVVNDIVDKLLFSGAIDLFQSVSNLFDAVSALLPRKLALVEPAHQLLHHMGPILRACANRCESLHGDDNEQFIAMREFGKQFFNNADTVLERAIVKQHPWLTIENYENTLANFDVYVAHLGLTFESVAKNIVEASGVNVDNFSSDEFGLLAATAWRYTTLRKFIRNGRMELRVSGIDSMAEGLVKAFRDFIQSPGNNLEHPTVRFLTQFIRRNELIRYIIGVDSHPQIIHRSFNVIGFLCVSRTYENDDTDVVWTAATESQDPRTRTEVLQVLQQYFEHLDFAALLYVTEKVFELSFARIDATLLDFIARLMHGSYDKIRSSLIEDESARNLSIGTMKLCLHLLQEANTPQNCASDIAVRIRQVIPEQIRLRLELNKAGGELGIPMENLQSILEQLRDEIASHSPRACGSVLGAMHMLHCFDLQTTINVVGHHGFVPLIVNDLVELVGPENSQNLVKLQWSSFDCYLRCWIFLVHRTPMLFDEALLESLWDNLLSHKQTQVEIRSRAWSSLGDVLKSSGATNVVLTRLIDKYYPSLDPDQYDEAVLHFAQQAVHYEARLSPPEFSETMRTIEIPGIERVWDIMLRTPLEAVEAAASDFIIRQYLDDPIIARFPLSVIEATHLALLERCVNQVIGSASKIRPVSRNSSTASQNEERALTSPSSEEIRFHHSLLFLRRFLEAFKARPHYLASAKADFSQLINKFPVKGAPLEMTLQIHNHSSLGPQMTKWTVGEENKASEIWQAISQLTRWSQFTVIHQGARVNFKDNETTLRDLSCAPAMLMVSKIPGTADVASQHDKRSASPVDDQIMHHFDDLYELLDLESHLAQEVYEFLIMFSSQDSTLAKLRSMKTPGEEILTVNKPFKLMYYLRALRSCIEDESFSSQPDGNFLIYAVGTIITSMSRFDDLHADFGIRMSIAYGLTEALVLAFRAKVGEEVSLSYLPDHNAFLKHIFSLWSQMQQTQVNPKGVLQPQNLARLPFEALIEGFLHDPAMWTNISIDTFTRLFSQAVLEHPNQEVRQGILEVVHSLTGNGPLKASGKPNDSRTYRSRFSPTTIDNLLSHLWSVCVEILPNIPSHSSTCLEFSDAMTSILKRVGKQVDETAIKKQVDMWKTLMLSHRHSEGIGLALQDFTILSFGKVLLECMTIFPGIVQELADHDAFGRDLFFTFVFPPLSDDIPSDHGVRNPVLETQTRHVIYDLLLALCRTEIGLDNIVAELNSDLVPKDEIFEPYINHDRQAIRSEVGYSGLRNLSNTCYLNSLLSQLFMNVEFRDLILNVDISDEPKQKLLSELGKVFAYMQNSYEEAVSPDAAVDSIIQWDGEQIDVTIQMDVDEFFNLLFDRLEFQIMDKTVRSRFKAIYGGQLVQQIKSKECEHVSETLEPFSAVQVEIKGKSGLEESLKAYVEGEVLQGENKYSCTGCGKHVDAVKRACLKDIPDHLIFNLKRFDYDIITGMRCKINDEFQFPATIDMNPYTLDALTDPDTMTKPDMFELVGVIIHSGTAESGHYYSYIRKRPSANAVEKTWVQFNDQDVTRFDPATIKDCCFGGVDFGALQCPKFYSGYMLFYQRTSSLQLFEQKYTQHDATSPVCLPLNPELEHHIDQQNELYLRTFVAQDPVHARFIRTLLQKLPVNSGKACSSDHRLELQVTWVVLDYVNQLSARWKELPEVEDTLKTLEIHATHCLCCAQDILKWVIKDNNFGDNVIRSCYPSVRKIFTQLICMCWQIWAERRDEDGEVDSVVSSPAALDDYLSLFADFVRVVHLNWDNILRHGRSWEQYFTLISTLSRLGETEAQAIIDEGLLVRILELVHAHVPTPYWVKRLRPRYQFYLNAREKNRPHHHVNLIQCFAELLEHVELDAVIRDGNARTQLGGKIGLTREEAELLDFGRHHTVNHWLRKLVLGGHNIPATDTIIAYVSKSNRFIPEVCTVLRNGFGDQNLFNAINFLRPCLTFISQSTHEEYITSLIESALQSIDTTQGQYGKEYLDFISALCNLENREIPIERGALRRLVLQYLGWWAPILLMYPNDLHADVRGDTVDFLNEILFIPFTEAEAKSNHYDYGVLLRRIQELIRSCASFAQRTFLDPQAARQGIELQAGQANNVLTVVETYLPLMMNNAAEEETAAEISSIMDNLKTKSDHVVDDIASDSHWKGTGSDFDALSDADLSEPSR